MEFNQCQEIWLRELNYLNPIEETKNMIDSQAIKNMCLHTSIDARINAGEILNWNYTKRCS